ncbi:lasso RiPP family leader peptide-containing protein [Streptomyces daghestanicus]|nr:lasso RiPP family leader peptide-containing protein [Streptomyces daghestanicus]
MRHALIAAESSYETPMLAEIGDFADVTRGGHSGRYMDFIIGWWF